MKLFPFCSLILFFSLCGMPVWGQTSSKIKRLQNQKKEIQKGLSRKQNELRDNRQNVNQKLRDIEMLSNQVENRQRYIDDMLYQIKGMDSLIARQQQVIESTAKDLERQKAAYVRALRYARVSKTDETSVRSSPQYGRRGTALTGSARPPAELCGSRY